MQTGVYNSILINDLMTFFALNIATNSCALQEDAQKVKRTLSTSLGRRKMLRLVENWVWWALPKKCLGSFFRFSCHACATLRSCYLPTNLSLFFSFEENKNWAQVCLRKKEVRKPLSMTKFKVQYINSKYLR